MREWGETTEDLVKFVLVWYAVLKYVLNTYSFKVWPATDN